MATFRQVLDKFGYVLLQHLVTLIIVKHLSVKKTKIKKSENSPRERKVVLFAIVSRPVANL